MGFTCNSQYKMKLSIFVCFVIVAFSCKARGWKDGTCTWITDTNRDDVGQFKCECSRERRGVRCNLGGDNTCYYSCVALGYSNGMCDEQDNCTCGGGNNRWGNFINNIRNRL